MDLTTITYALLAGLIPSFIWLCFWLKEDNLHPEPRSIITLAFIAGCIAVIISIFLEKYAQGLMGDTVWRFMIGETEYAIQVKYVIWSSIEEIVKFGAMMVIAFHADILDEPIDAMIYCITVALGFAALENTLFTLNPFHLGEFSTGIITGNLRFIGASLVHVVSSASIGFMIALTFYRGTLAKICSLSIGIILACVLHTSFNLAILNGTAMNTLKVFGWVWCAVVILIILFEEIKVIHPRHG